MKYDILNNTPNDALPVCRIQVDSPELEGMIRAILYGDVRFTDGDQWDILITADEDSVILSSPEMEHSMEIERPITANALRDAARTVIAPSKGTRFTADPATLSAVAGDVSVRLTRTEFSLFSAILENGDSFTSAEELSLAVWGRRDRNLCTVYISYLRRKLDSAFGDGTLVTARGKGYRLRDTDQV